MTFKRLRKAWHYFISGNLPYLWLKRFVDETYEKCGLSVPYFATLFLFIVICVGSVYLCTIIEEDQDVSI